VSYGTFSSTMFTITCVRAARAVSKCSGLVILAGGFIASSLLASTSLNSSQLTLW
jgi:hypothetical protein